MRELLHKRGLHSKLIDLENGFHKWIGSSRPQHVPSNLTDYRAGKAVTWTDIDTDIGDDNTRPGSGVEKWNIKNAYFHLEIFPDQIGYRYTSKDDGFFAHRLTKLDGKAINKVPAPTRVKNTIRWDNVAPGLSIVLRFSAYGVDTWKILTSNSAPREMTWMVSEASPQPLTIQSSVRGWDNWNKAASARPKPRRFVEVLVDYGPDLSAPAGQRRYERTETWTGRTWAFDLSQQTHPKVFYNDYIYPVHIDVDVTETISADSDDGDQIGSASWYSNHGGDHAYLANVSTGYRPAYRFTAVAVDQGQQLTLAELKWTVNSTASSAVPFYGIDEDDIANTFSSGSGKPSSLNITTASTTISASSSGANTLDVTSLCQEIFDRTGWSNGNAMGLTGRGTMTGSGHGYIGDSSGGTGPTLELTFAAAGGNPKGPLGLPLHGPFGGPI